MHQVTRQEQRKALFLWVKWAPPLLLLFGVLLLDTWLNMQTRNNDYELCRLRKHIRALSKVLAATKVEVAGLEDMDRLTGKASDFDLVDPEPGQIEMVYYDKLFDVVSPVDPLVMARLDEEPRPPAHAMAAAPLRHAALNDVETSSVMMEPLPVAHEEDAFLAEVPRRSGQEGRPAAAPEPAASAEDPIMLRIPQESFDEELALDDCLGDLLGAL